MAASLKILQSGDPRERAKVVPLEGSCVRIGREESNELRLLDLSVSRFHARILATDLGLLLSDHGSANGILVNGQEVANHFLADGDVFELGDVKLSYIEESENAPTLLLRRDRRDEPPPAPPGAGPAPQRSSVLRLVVLSSDDRGLVGREFPVAGKTLSLGRGEECDVTIDERRVSRRHASVLNTARGTMVLDDDSANGLWVGETQVSQHWLRRGDRFRIGRTTIELRGPAPDESTLIEPVPIPATVPEPELPPPESRKSVPPPAPPAVRPSAPAPPRKLNEPQLLRARPAPPNLEERSLKRPAAPSPADPMPADPNPAAPISADPIPADPIPARSAPTDRPAVVCPGCRTSAEPGDIFCGECGRKLHLESGVGSLDLR